MSFLPSDEGSLADLLTHWRIQRRWTQSQVASRAGISAASLSRWEAGKVQPRVRELEAVLDALEVPDALRAMAFRSIHAPRAVERIAHAEIRGTRGTDGDYWLSPPRTGDLLRALRSRANYTQMELAAHLGVQQSSVARWEATRECPNEEHLRMLCSLLNASPAEAEALAHGPFIAPTVWGKSLLEDAEWRHQQLRDQALFGTWHVADLAFFQLEADLSRALLTDERYLELLLQVFSTHARFLVWRRRFSEAARYIHLLRAGGQVRPLPDGSLPVPAQTGIILQAEQHIDAGKRVRAALTHLLHQESIITDPDHQSWLYMTVAEGFALLGHGAEALQFCARSVTIPLSDGEFRGDDPAMLLSRARVYHLVGSPRGTLRNLERLSGKMLTPAQSTLHEVLRAAALSSLGERSAAADAVREGYGRVARLGTVEYVPLLDEIAGKL